MLADWPYISHKQIGQYGDLINLADSGLQTIVAYDIVGRNGY